MGFLLDIASSWAFLAAHPIVGLTIFVLASAAVIFWLSGGRLIEAVGGMIRVAWTILSTPFVYLRDAMTIMRTSQEAEQDYAQSRIFMLFRLSRIQCLALLVVCLLGLSSGLASSVISLYPQAEIERETALATQALEIEAEVERANQAVAAVSVPTFRENLQTQRTETRQAYQQQANSNAELMANTTFTGPLLSQLWQAGNADYLRRIESNIDTYMSSCPRGYSWRGMTVETCAQYRDFASDLARRRIAEFDLAQAAGAADRAWRDADSAAQVAAAQLTDAQSRLQNTQEQLREASLSNLEWLPPRVWSALLGIAMTLVSVIVTVWVGATLISVFSWIVLMMRSLERSQTDYLKNARADPATPEI